MFWNSVTYKKLVLVVGKKFCFLPITFRMGLFLFC